MKQKEVKIIFINISIGLLCYKNDITGIPNAL